jgi:hypothetical protein
MTLLKKTSSSLDTSDSSTNPPKPATPLVFRKRIARFAIFGASAVLLLCVPARNHVLAKTAQAADAKDAIDQDAMDALTRMGTYLRTLKSFQVDADITHDDVLEDGEIVTDTRKDNLLAAPHSLRVEIKSDDRDTFLFYNGKDFTIYGKLDNFYATAPAPPTVAQFVDAAYEKYDIDVPLVDLFKWGTDESAVKKITSAKDLGPSTVEGVTCEHYAFRQEGIDWQIWIQLGDYPLPLRYIITTLTDDARPRHTSTLTWNLAPSYNEAAFTFEPPPDAHRITLADVQAGNTKAAQ